jgi:hypothetical protein
MWEQLIVDHGLRCARGFWPPSGYDKVPGAGVLITLNGMSLNELNVVP